MKLTERQKALYRLIINSLGFSWLAIGSITVLRHSLPLGIGYLAVIGCTVLAVAYVDCRSCPRRFGGCTHYVIGKLTRLLPEKKPGQPGFGGHVLLGALWTVVHLTPQYWLWRNIPLLLLFWALPITALIFMRTIVCGNMCDNKECPMNQNYHKLPWKSCSPNFEGGGGDPWKSEGREHPSSLPVVKAVGVAGKLSRDPQSGSAQ